MLNYNSQFFITKGKQQGRPMSDFDELNKAVDSLSDQKKKLEIALYYTHGDAEKSKKMMSGIYKDICVIKVRFSASNTFGLFLMFFNTTFSSLVHSTSVLTRSYELEETKTNMAWLEFEEEIVKIKETGKYDGEMTSKMRDFLSDSFVIKLSGDQRANELKSHLDASDEIAANRVLKKFIMDRFGFHSMDLSADYEQISSLDMELFSKTSIKIDMNKLMEEQAKEEGPEIEVFQEEEEELKGRDVEHVLAGTPVLSPIKGKGISSVKNGDRLKINLVTTDARAISLAKAFNAYDDGDFKPISGRVVSIRHMAEGGYVIFCAVAKGIYVRIEELEEDIKVAVNELENLDDPEIEASGVPMLLIIAIALILLLGLAIVYLIIM